jgi:AraC family transcriptional regulator, transcriptional activator of pobA
MLINSETAFEIQTLEYTIQKDFDNMSPFHVQKQFELIWLQQGSGTHTINEEQYSIADNTICIALPGQKHKLILQPGAKGYIICFNAACYFTGASDNSMVNNSSFFHFLSMNHGLVLEDEQAEDIEEICKKLMKEVSRYSLARVEILVKYLQIMMICLKEQIEVSQAKALSSGTNSLLNNFLWLLENNFLEKKSVSAYAKELFVSPNYLNFVVKKNSGYSVSHHIRHRIILEAKRKAQDTGATMKEIAYYLGFYDIAHFSKFFKNTSGINFTIFKKELAESYTV